ncbi:hypothetical protein YC2023_094763 [Brassica napus]
MDLNFKLFDTCDLDTQGLIAALNATSDAEVFCDDGKKQERKRRLIEVDDDEGDTDVEITFPPTQSSQPGKQTSTGSGSVSNSKKPMVQSSIYGGIGSSLKAHQGKKNRLLLQYVEGGGVPSRLQKVEKKDIKNLSALFESISFTYIFRSENVEADRLAKTVLRNPSSSSTLMLSGLGQL